MHNKVNIENVLVAAIFTTACAVCMTFELWFLSGFSLGAYSLIELTLLSRLRYAGCIFLVGIGEIIFFNTHFGVGVFSAILAFFGVCWIALGIMQHGESKQTIKHVR